jgi:FkbM family methyltransferase
MARTYPARSEPGVLRRLASAAVLGYLRHFPLERGKWRLMSAATVFLVAELEPDLWIRLANLSYVERGILREGVFEQETVELFTALLAPGMTILDVGANIGQYTLIAARHVGERGRVHAFEPTPEVAARLRNNVALNGLGNVAIREAAVSDTTGEAVLYYSNPEDPGENSIVGATAGLAAPPSVRVPTITLDDYVAAQGLETVDVIKMDIEGAEPLALRGGRALLAGEQAPVIILELNPKTLAVSGSSQDELLGLLREYGYGYYPIATYGRDLPSPWSNGLAAKPAHWERFPALANWQLRPQPGPVPRLK